MYFLPMDKDPGQGSCSNFNWKAANKVAYDFYLYFFYFGDLFVLNWILHVWIMTLLIV